MRLISSNGPQKLGRKILLLNLLASCAYEAQLRFVAITRTPNGCKRFAKSIPMFPKPKMNIYITIKN